MAKAKSNSANKNMPIYVIAGKNDALVSKTAQDLLDNLIEPDKKSSALLTLDGPDANPPDVLDELRTLPFLAEKRIVLIRSADKFITNNRTLLEKYFDAPSSTGILILTVTSWQSNTRLAKKLPKPALIKVTEPKGAKLPAELIAYTMEKYNKNLPPQSAHLLIELAGDELVNLLTEIDKLALYSADEKQITSQHVEQLVGSNRFYNVFAVIDAILDSNPAKAVTRLRKMFEEDKSAEYTAIGAFAYHFRKMFQAKAMLAKGANQYQTANQCRIFGDRDAFFRQLAKLSIKQIGDTIEWLAETDYMIKTGQTETKVAIEQLVLKLASK